MQDQVWAIVNARGLRRPTAMTFYNPTCSLTVSFGKAVGSISITYDQGKDLYNVSHIVVGPAPFRALTEKKEAGLDVEALASFLREVVK